MKSVNEMTVQELLNRLSVAIYYGMATCTILRNNESALQAIKTLVAELRQDNFLSARMEENG